MGGKYDLGSADSRSDSRGGVFGELIQNRELIVSVVLSEDMLHDMAIAWPPTMEPAGEVGYTGLSPSSEKPSLVEPGQYCSGILEES
jgi:hypothetical protein